jgi:hypothetical protein
MHASPSRGNVSYELHQPRGVFVSHVIVFKHLCVSRDVICVHFKNNASFGLAAQGGIGISPIHSSRLGGQSPLRSNPFASVAKSSLYNEMLPPHRFDPFPNGRKNDGLADHISTDLLSGPSFVSPSPGLSPAGIGIRGLRHDPLLSVARALSQQRTLDDGFMGSVSMQAPAVVRSSRSLLEGTGMEAPEGSTLAVDDFPESYFEVHISGMFSVMCEVSHSCFWADNVAPPHNSFS